MNATKVARKLRVRIDRFSGDLSRGLCIAAQRFVSKMVYGIQASESVQISSFTRRAYPCRRCGRELGGPPRHPMPRLEAGPGTVFNGHVLWGVGLLRELSGLVEGRYGQGIR